VNEVLPEVRNLREVLILNWLDEVPVVIIGNGLFVLGCPCFTPNDDQLPLPINDEIRETHHAGLVIRREYNLLLSGKRRFFLMAIVS
jgi:hypothetical protein